MSCSHLPLRRYRADIIPLVLPIYAITCGYRMALPMLKTLGMCRLPFGIPCGIPLLRAILVLVFCYYNATECSRFSSRPAMAVVYSRRPYSAPCHLQRQRTLAQVIKTICRLTSIIIQIIPREINRSNRHTPSAMISSQLPVDTPPTSADITDVEYEVAKNQVNAHVDVQMNVYMPYKLLCFLSSTPL